MKKDYYEDIVEETYKDFYERREARRSYELQWRLNMNYLIGNQYCEISPKGDIEDMGKQYFWQEREVYNHVASIVETRIAKLARVKANVIVRPISGDASDINTAKLSSKIITAVGETNYIEELIIEANTWSEVCGTAFYKICWNKNKGKIIGKNGRKIITEGDIEITVCPPYEIYPDSLNASRVEDNRSIIHARAYHIDAILDKWGIETEGEEVDVFLMENSSIAGGLGYTASVPKVILEKKKNHAIVIEKYIAPTQTDPYGKLIIVGGGKLLYYGDLPYLSGQGGTRGYPFIKQTSISQAGAFYGISVIERTIPVQRAYNAVKNRKHEFLNRIAMGVLAVEDGSVDTENLEEEGLSPGKVLIYRQGSTPPRMLDAGNVPNDFLYEEERLLQEFTSISGVSETMQYSKIPANVTSGVALNLLLEQDDTRLLLAADNIRQAVRNIGYIILRLYKQFASGKRLMRISGDNGEVELIYFTASDINAECIIFETDNELLDSPASRRSMVLELMKMGVLTDDNGKVSSRNKTKVMELLGFGNWENSRDIAELHMKVAGKENLSIKLKEKIEVKEYDDHELHIEEHTKFLLTEGKIDELCEHIKEHHKYSNLIKRAEILNNGGENNG